MKASIYTTNEYGAYIAKPLTHGTSMSGITTAVKCEHNANTDFLGFGVAITGSSCYNLSRMEGSERYQLLQKLYTKDGLNFQIGRLTIGASDYSAEVYTYDDGDEDLTLEHFSIDRDKEYIIPMIKEILEVNPDLTLFASPWSPPGWMKTGGSIGGGYMREKYLDCYADYLVKYIKAYEAEGINIHAITPQNEPETQQSGQMPACIWHPDLEAKFIGLLRKKFDEHSIDTKIWCYDHNFNGAHRVAWCFKEYSSLKDDCDGIAFHYYGGSIEQTTFLKNLYPDLGLHFTEGGPRLTDNYATDWCKWGLMITRVLCNRYSSFTGWNLMLDETGGPNIGPFPCGGLVTRNSLDGTLTYSGQYKAFCHFKTLPSDAAIYPLNFERQGMAMKNFPRVKKFFTEGCIAENTNGQTVLFLVNPDDQREQIQYFHRGSWWYIEMLPNTIATVVFEE